MNYRFIITGGGTSGHINPAITIADSLKEYYASCGDTVDIIFTGRKKGLEGELVPKAGYEFRNITAKPFPMRPSVKMIKAIAALNEGKKQCAKIIDEFNPDAVIGTGGYVCGPLLMEASKKKVPVILHESNAFPGRANKLLGRKAQLVMTGFPNQEKSFSKAKKVVCTGNPIRQTMLGTSRKASREKLGLTDDTLMVFAMGGSLGSKTINDFVIEAASRPEFSRIKFVLGAGKQQHNKLDETIELPSNLTVIEYIDNPQDYLTGADICITRAGAVTCAEIAATGACSVMVPYPFAAHDHQTFNARAFEKVGGCVLISDESVVQGKLFEVLKNLIDDENKRESMRQKALTLAVTDCNKRIAEAIASVVNERK